jgi:hypothetical protein
VPVLDDLPPAGTARLLRRAVLDLARSEHRAHFVPALHTGRPGGPVVSVYDDLAWDHGLRTDVAAAVLGAFAEPPAMTWLTRSGAGTLHDVDAAWLGPVLAAYAEQGRDPHLRRGHPARLDRPALRRRAAVEADPPTASRVGRDGRPVQSQV